ncbi:MAG: hypothetical protein CSA11_00895 [Chloroflexi bacterium]|nr:MAG: hypothetical protein CSB13_00695 [Chloroflexota bacterium]PIE82374.1 MAG: hypothetical protein CSA11_00895 [Chloroflexota bacterium]
MVFKAHRLSVKPKEANTFQPRLDQLTAKLVKTPGFDHYRLIPRNESGNAYTLLTFWHNEKNAKDAKMNEQLCFFHN